MTPTSLMMHAEKVAISRRRSSNTDNLRQQDHDSAVSGDYAKGGGGGASVNYHAPRGIRIAVCFVGHQAPGALNVVYGVHDYTANLNPPGTCVGILGGLVGLIHGYATVITEHKLALFKNQGGMDLLCRTTERIQSAEQLKQCQTSIEVLQLDGVILVGAFATIANAAVLSEYLLSQGSPACVAGVPMTVDNGIPLVEVSLGHDTNVKVTSSIIGALMTISRSTKCWYFVRVTGWASSHLCVECALETCPTIVLISEEVESRRMSLVTITNMIADIVTARSQRAINFGVVVLPDNLLAYVPEMQSLISEMDTLWQHMKYPANDSGLNLLTSRLTPWSAALFTALPSRIQWQIGFAKDLSENVDLTLIDTEILLMKLVQAELSRRRSIGTFVTGTFNVRSHCLSYEGRSALPTNFDCNLGYSLGYTACVLVDGGRTGYLATLSNVGEGIDRYLPGGIPFTSLIDARSVRRQVLKPPVKNETKNYGEAVCVGGSQNAGSNYDSPTGNATGNATGNNSGIGMKSGASAGGVFKSLEVFSLSATQSGDGLIDLSSNTSHTTHGGTVCDSSRMTTGTHTGEEAESVVMYEVRADVKFASFDLDSPLFKMLTADRKAWAFTDSFVSPGPVQFSGEKANRLLHKLRVPSDNPSLQLKEISELFSRVKSVCSTSASPHVLQTMVTSLRGLVLLLETMASSKKQNMHPFGGILSQCSTAAWLSAAESYGSVVEAIEELQFTHNALLHRYN
eukprot:Lankesteria_metandrocarpae@DN4123_c0_g1_i1.p1